MSFFSSLIFIFLFCLFVNLCTARHLELLFRMGSTAEVPFSSEGSVGKGKTYGGAIDHNARETGAAVKEVKHVGKGAVPSTNSLVWHSWRAPKEIHEGHAEFFSDYSRPRTRPPSHN